MMKQRSIPTPHILGLAVLGLIASAPGQAAAQDKKPEWVLSLGGTATGAVPSFDDGWQVLLDEDFASARFSASSEYAPVTSTGLHGTAQVWLPSGLGFFAEVQQESQKVKARHEEDLALSFRECPTCPSFTFNAEGATDAERFQRDDTRVHMGLGYRLKLTEKLHLEATGGVTRFSLDQTLARELDDSSDDLCLISFPGQTCQLPLRVSDKEKQGANAWGFNAGAGLSFFFTRNVGLAAGVRYSRGGTVELEGLDAYDEHGGEFRTKVEVRPGGVSANLGLRVRF
jgi:opacity protein-like surface antigen